MASKIGKQNSSSILKVNSDLEIMNELVHIKLPQKTIYMQNKH